MPSFNLNAINDALCDSSNVPSGVDFSGKSLKLDTEIDAKPMVEAINSCRRLQYLTLTGNTLGVAAAQSIASALERHPELKTARWSDMFTGRMKTEIPPALSALGDGMIAAQARLTTLDLSDNAFGPIGVEGLAKLLQSDVCSQLQELRLNNNGLGITGARLLAKALSARPPRLRVFIAGRNRLENDGAAALAHVFEKMGSLEEVAMPQNGIYHVGITALAEAFKSNPQLTCLNLNDNTIGPQGAAAIAAVLPGLKNLKSINFGDCLLKNKGAKALAKAFKESSLPLEVLDVSHNEIGRLACLELVQCVRGESNNDTLSRVVLAGNSLGDSNQRKLIRDTLGSAAELDDGDGSEEYVTDSDDESDESDADGSEDSATEDAQHLDSSDIARVSIDNSGIEEVHSDVSTFIQYPTVENLNKLGANAADVIDAHLRTIKNPECLIESYVEATFCVCGLTSSDVASRATAERLVALMLLRAGEQPAAAWILANNVLMGLQLIKSENKRYKVRWDLFGCYTVLDACITGTNFPPALRDTLRFFINAKRTSMPEELAQHVATLSNLVEKQ